MPRGQVYDANVPRNKSLLQILGENVHGIMERRGLNQQQVATRARRAGTAIDQTTVGRVARAKDPTRKIDPPTLRTVEGLAGGLGVDAHLLLIDGLDISSLFPAAEDGLDLTDAQIADVQRAKNLLSHFTTAQRDLFINSDELKLMAGITPHFPVDKMQGEWTGPQAERPSVQQPKAPYRKKLQT